MIPAPPIPLQPALDLQRSLLLRGGCLALLLLMLAIAWDGHEQRRAAIDALPETAALVAQLLNEDLARRSGSFDREALPIHLDALDGLARRLPLCLQIDDLRGRRLAGRCDDWPPGSAAGRWLGQQLQAHLAQPIHAEVPLLLPAGIKAASVDLQVHWAAVGEAWWQRIRHWLVLGLGLALIVIAVTRVVGRALRPAQAILAALGRLEAGDHGVRLPLPQLRELRDVALRFNRLAERWQSLLAEQQGLSTRLLNVREQERRRLARELHDEMSQSLSALRAEAAVLTLRPDAAAGERIGALAGQLLDGLQSVLDDLRPAALDRFGLAVALPALVATPRRRGDGALLDCRLQLDDAGLDRLPEDIAVHLYRIVQEALTNAARHGDAARAVVAIARLAGPRLRITVDDDGHGPGSRGAVPGHGLLGIDERVRALAGSLHVEAAAGRGLRLRIELPLPPAASAGP
ncbi:MAG: histidine kinase [Xanthomonadaceae bacterium]|nr:histidine kinase [Xanthomonadaceae bacterium]